MVLRLIVFVAVVAMVAGMAVAYSAQPVARPGTTGQGMQHRYGQVGAGPAGAGMGGWWTRVNARTPEQRAFISEVRKLHEQIKAKQLEVATLQAENASAADIAARQKELDALRTQLRATMVKHRAVCTQLGVRGCAQCGDVHSGACPIGLGAGMGAGAGRGGWWTRVQPQTAEQRAFVDQVKSLHSQIRAAQAAGDQAKVRTLRTRLHDVMMKNRSVLQQMMMASPRGGGMGAGKK